MHQATHLDQRIGQLNNGRYYAFVNGYDKPEFVGALDEVQCALGLRQQQPVAARAHNMTLWDVRLRFQYPAWDEVDGILYTGIEAPNKSAANRIARLNAHKDGHLCGGQGRVTFTSTESQEST